MSRGAWALAALLLGGCVDLSGPFRCTQDAQCVDHGASGTCEPEGYCAFPVPDSTCASGQRFAPLSGDLGGACVVSSPSNPSLCSAGSFQLCDGFEAPTLSSLWTPRITANASIAPDTTRAYRGLRSLHVHRDAIGAGEDPSDTIFATPPVSSAQYLRAFFYVPSPVPNVFATLMGSDANDGGFDFVVSGGHLDLNDWFIADDATETATVLPTDQWVCVELAITPNASGGSDTLQLSMNGVAQSIAGYSSVSVPDVARSVYLGLGVYQPPALPAVDLWIDEIATDDAPIGCER